MDILIRMPSIRSSPWNIAKISSDNQKYDYIDISPCALFKQSSYNDYFVPEVCKSSHICHNITSIPATKNSPAHTESIGYTLQHVYRELSTVKAVYVGSECQSQRGVNHTISIRYICSNHLGRPAFPIFDFHTNCSKILNWETSAACTEQKSTTNFGSNEMKCYVLDDKNEVRDLTPLILKNGSYQVLTHDGELLINVCSDIVSRDCPIKDSSSCLRKGNGYESLGSYKWSSMKFVPATQLNQNDYIELAYQVSNSKCKPKNAVTKIRFICPKQNQFYSSERSPILISDLDCEYIIEWVTEHACSLSETTVPNQNCRLETVDFNVLNSTEFEFENVSIFNKNHTIILNLCKGVSKSCSSTSSVCLSDGVSYRSIGSRLESKFFRTSSKLDLIFKSKKPYCPEDQTRMEQVIIEMKCDPSSLNSTPEFVGFFDCTYQFHWQTFIVCPLFDQSPKCSYVNYDFNNQLIQIDLSPLRLHDSYYNVTRDPNNPKRKYSLPLSQKIIFNVCDKIPNTNNLTIALCSSGSACLIDISMNKTFNIGQFRQSLSFNEQSKSLELIYGGYDANTNHTVGTRIIFVCHHHEDEIYFIDFDHNRFEYVIEFRTVHACPLQQMIGESCRVQDSITGHTFDLNPLRSSNYYLVRSDDDRHEYLLNVCGPIANDTSCSTQSAICQREVHGENRNFSLGLFSDKLVYWNSILNLSFSNGDRYNDPKQTPRRSQITFVCDPLAGKGHPEYVGEVDRSYSFIWHTSLACSGKVPKKTHCVFENDTHIIDLSPLSLERGNHFVFDEDDNAVIYINFCRSLNRIRDNQLRNCSPNSASCILKNNDPSQSINLGEPSQIPFTGYDGNVHLIYNNGDQCPHNKALNWTTDLKLHCDRESGEDVRIMIVKPDFRHQCTYEFIVHTPLACPIKLTDIQLKNCTYSDPRTNFSVDFKSLMLGQRDYEINDRNRPSTKLYLNLCRPVDSVQGECVNSSVCLLKPDRSVVSYGLAQKLRIHFESDNLHFHYVSSSRCDANFTPRYRSTDIEMICDRDSTPTPTLLYQDDCLLKFQWRNSLSCNLKIPSCTIFDDENNYYSLRQLSSKSHSWIVPSNRKDEVFMINVCKPLNDPAASNCGSLSTVCKCTNDSGSLHCIDSLGIISDHEISIDSTSKKLQLTYEEEHSKCNSEKSHLRKAWRTQIEFHCSNKTGLDGPKFLVTNDCVNYFIWNTSFACPHNLNLAKHEDLTLDQDLKLHDHINNVEYDLKSLLSQNLTIIEDRQQTDRIEHYNYHFNFVESRNLSNPLCSRAAVCQSNGKDLNRDIGSLNNWKFVLDNIALHITIQSNTSKCGRNPSKFASTKIFLECIETIDSKLSFLYESDDCEYYFLWKTNHLCSLLSSASSPNTIHHNDHHHQKQKQHQSSTSIVLPLIFLLILILCLAFLVNRYYRIVNLSDNFRRWSRLNCFGSNGSATTADVNFRYQQVSFINFPSD
ncbi:cation-independent mannose-6-phosphate receptor-like protein [Sarcoptes scabiei]|uniref:Cation-independent mannose-6-phosphate receptor-like protein n=1 Tax=Sarcoptes scabiei TaxID=52283 RepID=A0A131ZW46_SARSC|nr:cation-independent mannose-6-phosphate receptor-like protein [Sarcoptes scabiei]